MRVLGKAESFGGKRKANGCLAAVRESLNATRLPGHAGRRREVGQLLAPSISKGSLCIKLGSTLGTWMRRVTFRLVLGGSHPSII